MSEGSPSPVGLLTHEKERQQQFETLKRSGSITLLIDEAEKRRNQDHDTSSIVVLESAADRASVSWEFALAYKKTRKLTEADVKELSADELWSYKKFESTYTPKDHETLKGQELRAVTGRLTARRVSIECQDPDLREIDILVSTPEGMKSVTEIPEYMAELRVMDPTFNGENPAERFRWMIHTAAAYAKPTGQDRQYLDYADENKNSFVARMIPQRTGDASQLLYPQPDDNSSQK